MAAHRSKHIAERLALVAVATLTGTGAFSPSLSVGLRPVMGSGFMGLGRRAMVVRVGVRMKDGGSKGPSVSEKGREESIGSIGSGSGSGQPGALRSSTKPLQTGTTWSLRTTETAASPSRIEKQPAGNMEPLSGATVAFNGLLVNVLKGMIDSVYQGCAVTFLSQGRDFARFYVLETVARVPYFSYMSVLHMYETIGLHRKANWIKVHFAEADNELHHLLIMESLGGNKVFADRFFAEHAAFAYYWLVVGLYILNPRGAYHLSQLIEDHAYKTYDKFLKDHEFKLKSEPAPRIALDYYMGHDHYMFDTFHTALQGEPRRPQIENLYDVFECIRDDEGEHRASLKQLVDVGRICSRHCTPSPACSIYADMCDVVDATTAHGQGTLRDNVPSSAQEKNLKRA